MRELDNPRQSKKTKKKLKFTFPFKSQRVFLGREAIWKRKKNILEVECKMCKQKNNVFKMKRRFRSTKNAFETKMKYKLNQRKVERLNRTKE